jgi:hypothetical protein
VTARERRREAAGQGVKSPWFVRIPYTGGYQPSIVQQCSPPCVCSHSHRRRSSMGLSYSGSLCCSSVLAAGRCVPQPPHTALLVSQLLRHGCALLSALCDAQTLLSDPGFPLSTGCWKQWHACPTFLTSACYICECAPLFCHFLPFFAIVIHPFLLGCGAHLTDVFRCCDACTKHLAGGAPVLTSAKVCLQAPGVCAVHMLPCIHFCSDVVRTSLTCFDAVMQCTLPRWVRF